MRKPDPESHIELKSLPHFSQLTFPELVIRSKSWLVRKRGADSALGPGKGRGRGPGCEGPVEISAWLQGKKKEHGEVEGADL